MGWTSYWVGPNCNRKEECMKYIKGFKDTEGKVTSKLLKSVMKGTTFYALMETREGVQWVLCLLTSIRKNEFYYKDIQCNPRENGGIPMSIVKAFKPSNQEDAEWKERQICLAETKKAKVDSVRIGDIVKCKAKYDITWPSGHEIKEGEEFLIGIKKKWGSSKNIKEFHIYEKQDLIKLGKEIGKSEAEMLEKTNGERYRYLDTNLIIRQKTFKSLEILEKI